MNNKLILLAFITFFLASCTSITVQELAPKHKVSHICIQQNPKVIVGDFLPVVQRGFMKHGITTEIFEEEKPFYCDYYLTYTAFKTWDIGMYMHHAELSLYTNHKMIGYGEYHLNGKGGLALNKWASVESKMMPVIDQLLVGYTPEKVKLFKNKQKKDAGKHATSNEEAIGGSIEEQLRKLKQWFEEGLISEEEYKLEKEKILSKQ